jgi:hypothetical protein
MDAGKSFRSGVLHGTRLDKIRWLTKLSEYSRRLQIGAGRCTMSNERGLEIDVTRFTQTPDHDPVAETLVLRAQH